MLQKKLKILQNIIDWSLLTHPLIIIEYISTETFL